MKMYVLCLTIPLMVCCLNLNAQNGNVEVVPVQVERRHGMALKITGEPKASLLKNPDKLLIRKQGTTTAIWGQFQPKQNSLLFYPRVPLIKSINYELANRNDNDIRVLATFTLGEHAAIKRTKVEAIYPLSSVLPQNLLRIHIKFSRPMAKSVSGQFVQLIDMTDGTVEKNVFERMKHEFWSEEGTQLSLYLDPGRIKTGLELNRTLGMPLKLGHTYKLKIDPAWEDMYGAPLLSSMEKVFKVGPVDKEKLKEADLTVSSNKSEGILVNFGHLINEPQLKGYAKVIFNKEAVAGEWKVLSNSLMKFIPEKDLEVGAYTLFISSDLEDPAGNSFRMHFESKYLTEYAEPYLIEKQFFITNKTQN